VRNEELKLLRVESGDMTTEQNLDKNLENLINFSLIEQECLDKAGNVKRFRVSPFVDQYIHMKIDIETRKESLNIICSYLLG